MDQVNAPYLLLVNHSSTVDYSIMLRATHPHPVNNLLTLKEFSTYPEPLLRSMGVVGTRKIAGDRYLLKNIRYCLNQLKSIFVLFPEGQYSLDGCTSCLPESLGKLVTALKVPVVVLRIHGSFVSCPQWNKINKKSHVEAEMIPVVTAKEAEELSPAQINEKIRESFAYDDFRWQYEHGIRISHPERARGLHALLYKCPACRKEFRMDSAGTKLWCRECGKRWEMDEYGRLQARKGETEFAHIPDWSRWERQCVREEIENGTYFFQDTVQVETLPGSGKFYPQGEGRLVQTPAGTRLECSYYGEDFTLVRTARSLESLHIEYDYLGRGDCVDLSIPDDSFWCYLTKRDAVTKLAFATEEMHKIAKKRAGAEKRE